MPAFMTDMEGNEIDTRPLSEKLADQIRPASFTLDLSHGEEVRLIGNAHDIDRVKSACKQFLKRIESDRLNPSDQFTVVVPPRDTE